MQHYKHLSFPTSKLQHRLCAHVCHGHSEALVESTGENCGFYVPNLPYKSADRDGWCFPVLEGTGRNHVPADVVRLEIVSKPVKFSFGLSLP